MEHNEILIEMEMDYKTLVGYLIEKYGAAKYDCGVLKYCYILECL